MDFRTPRVRRAAVITALALLVIIAYIPVLSNGFVNYDDPGYVTRNAHVLGGLTWQTIAWACTAFESANWHPLTWISHALDVALFGLNPAYHHAVNLLFHLLNSVLLFLLLERMTGRTWESAFVAVIFAVHPLHVESVAWIAERKDLLSGLFWILTLGAYANYRKTGRMIDYIVTLLFFALGLLAKPMIVTLPFLLLVLDYWPLREGNGRGNAGGGWFPELMGNVVAKIPFFALSAASAVVTWLAQKEGGSMSQLPPIPVMERIANAAASYGLYLRKFIWPADLAVFYPYPGYTFGSGAVWASLGVLCIVSIIVWRARKREPSLLAGWLWFLGTLVPVIGLVQVGLQGMADRYMYMPMVGIAIVVSWGLSSLIRTRPALIRPAVVTAAALGILMGVATFSQAATWHSTITLFEKAAAAAPENDVVENNLGTALADEGRDEEAIPHLLKAVRLRPGEPSVHKNLGRSLAAVGRTNEALAQYLWLKRHLPPDPALGTILGELYTKEGRYDEAIPSLADVIRMDPRNADALNGLGFIYERKNLPDSALPYYARAVSADPSHWNARENLGTALAVKGRLAEAEEQWKAAASLNPAFADPHANLGRLYLMQNRLPEAERELSTAIRLDSTNMQAKNNLRQAFERMGRRQPP